MDELNLKLPKLKMVSTPFNKTLRLSICGGIAAIAYLGMREVENSLMRSVNRAIQEDIPQIVNDQLK